MFNKVKGILFKILGLKAYLKVLHFSFVRLFRFNLLKGNEEYKFNYFVKNLIHSGDIVVDIGANLGYFSSIFIKLTGKSGKVICIEPVKPFYETLVWGLGKYANCTIYNYALGTEKKMVELVLPKFNGVFRTGLPHIPDNDSEKQDSYVFETQMTRGSELLIDLPKIDYIKCDIEGYEQYVLPEIKIVFEKFRPILQVETWGIHKPVVMSLMKEMNYIAFTLDKNKLIADEKGELNEGDILFVPAEKLNKIEHLI